MWNFTQVLGLLLVQLLTLDYPLSTLQRGDEASTEYPENDLLRLVLQKVPSEANPKVRNHGDGPY